MWWRCNFISHDIVNVFGAHRAAESHELDLDWRWAESEHIRPLSHRPPVKIEQYLNILRVDKRCQLGCVESLWDLHEFVAALLDIAPVRTIVGGAKTESYHVELATIVPAED